MIHYLDTHFHLDLHKDQQIADKIEAAKVFTIAVTNTPSVFFYTKNISLNKKYIRAGLGLHPQLAEQRKNELPMFKELLNETRYVGEIGLDNALGQDFEIQKKVFKQIVEWSGSMGSKIMTLHSRRAEKEVIDIIGENYPCKVILHWYSGSLRQLEKAIEFGFYFSINYPMTQSENGRKIISQIPIDKILTETDAPFGKIDSPIEIQKVVESLSKIRSEASSTVIYQNFKNILNN